VAEVNCEAIHISLSNDEVEALIEVLSNRVVWQYAVSDAVWQDQLHSLFDALGVEVVT
jgi:hypothetical protein